MIKSIPVARLVPGMFVHSLNCDWIEHDFLRSAFLVRDEATVARVRAIGVRDVLIDTGRGADLPAAAEETGAAEPAAVALQADPPDVVAPPAASEGAARDPESGNEVDASAAAPQRTRQDGGDEAKAPDAAGENPRAFGTVPVATEIGRARRLYLEAQQIVRELMDDVRFGRPLRIAKAASVVERVIASIFRQPSALLPLVRLKEHDQYTFMHSVATCALLANLGRALRLPGDEILAMSIGALLHDVGKARVPDDILNKPAKLSEAEFEKMKSHVVQTKIILHNTPGVGPIALGVAAEHHERFDGSGYPNRLRGDEISRHGQMGAIVDVYDALTSDRVYHKGLPPTLALRKLLEGSGKQFDPKLVHAFIHALGIYPSGSLVRLESGTLAVVQEQNPANALQPRLLVIFDIARQCYVAPYRLDLADGRDRIVQYEDFAHWRIDARHWLPGEHQT